MGYSIDCQIETELEVVNEDDIEKMLQSNECLKNYEFQELEQCIKGESILIFCIVKLAAPVSN